MLLIKLFRVRHSLSWLIHCINGAASDAGLTTPGNYAIASVPQRLKRNAAKTVAEKKLVELFKKAEKLHLELMND